MSTFPFLHTFHSEHYTFQFSSQIGHFERHWDHIDSSKILLSLPYLKALELSMPAGLSPGYIMVSKEGKAIGKIIIQFCHFNAVQRLHLETYTGSGNILSGLKFYGKKILASFVNFRVAVFGNLLTTGAYGFDFISEITQEEKLKIIRNTSDWILNAKEVFPDISVILCKEFSPAQRLILDPYSTPVSYFTEFEVQPGMIFYFDNNWKSLDDYMQDLQSKYRLRIRKALSAGEFLLHKELTLDEMEAYKFQIFELYHNLADRADFNLVELDVDYFIKLKLSLHDHFKLYGYFKKDELLSFYTTLNNGPELIAHFLGVNKNYNEHYAIYFNILVHLIHHGIQQQHTTLNLARTALEIKSSVGAGSQPLYCYLRHKNPIIQFLSPLILRFLKPKMDWVQRHPFKKKQTSGL